MSAHGTYCCFVREIVWTGGPRQGETETLTGGELELDIITDQKLLWQYQDGETVHGGQALTLLHENDALTAHEASRDFTIRIALGPEPMRFTAHHPTGRLSGICHFQSRVTP